MVLFKLDFADDPRSILAPEDKVAVAGPDSNPDGIESRYHLPPQAGQRNRNTRGPAAKLARLLKPYGIKARGIRLPDGTTPRGYMREDFKETWKRYCPSKRPENATTQQIIVLRGKSAFSQDATESLLQEVQDYDACARLAEAIRPHTYQVAICSAFKDGEQQVAILGKEPAQAAWAEPWKSMEGVDPPRGFAFAWFKIGNGNIGVYSVHLKSNLIMRGNKEVETARNIRKREVATDQFGECATRLRVSDFKSGMPLIVLTMFT